jgi:hypothetical protein
LNNTKNLSDREVAAYFEHIAKTFLPQKKILRLGEEKRIQQQKRLREEYFRERKKTFKKK